MYEVARWGLAGAPNVRVLKPQELKKLVRDFAKPVTDEMITEPWGYARFPGGLSPQKET